MEVAAGGAGRLRPALTIAGREFGSRLVLGTGGFRNLEVMAAGGRASGAEMATVAMRRVDPSARGLDARRARGGRAATCCPNTAGCFTARDAVTTARLAREALETDWVKLEVIGDDKTLLPDPAELLEAAETLVAEGFTVLPTRTTTRSWRARLEDAGCAAVMPLGSPIGSGMGIHNPYNLRLIVEQARRAGDPRRRRRHGLRRRAGDGGWAATACCWPARSRAPQDPAAMAAAMRKAVEAGCEARGAGRIPRRLYAEASAPDGGRGRAHVTLERARARCALDALADRWLAAWAGDAGFAACCTADVSYEDPVARDPLRGAGRARGARARLRRRLSRPADGAHRAARSATRDHACVAVARCRHPHAATSARCPATDRFVTLHGVHFVELTDGRVRRARGFFDLYDGAACSSGCCPAAAAWGRPRCCCCAASASALAREAALLDVIVPVMPGVDRADVVDRAGVVERLLERVALFRPPLPELKSGAGPSSLVTSWRTESSLVHVTVPPFATVTSFGLNAMSFIVTAARLARRRRRRAVSAPPPVSARWPWSAAPLLAARRRRRHRSRPPPGRARDRRR